MAKTVHLFRGASSVRSWSKYQETVRDWTLCGIDRRRTREPSEATEDASLVSCPYCHELMAPMDHFADIPFDLAQHAARMEA